MDIKKICDKCKGIGLIICLEKKCQNNNCEGICYQCENTNKYYIECNNCMTTGIKKQKSLRDLFFGDKVKTRS